MRAVPAATSPAVGIIADRSPVLLVILLAVLPSDAARTGYSIPDWKIRGGGDVLEDGVTGGLRGNAPGLGGFFERGSLVSVYARTGNDLQGYVCEADGRGLLLDVRDPSGDAGDYEFLPWSSIERVSIEG